MTHAYNEIYLESAMIRLGDMLEYACLDMEYDPDAFWKMFIHSGLSFSFELGNPSVVAGLSGVELAQKVIYIEDPTVEFANPSWFENRSSYFWCGWVLAYYQWYTSKNFQDIWNHVSIHSLLNMYSTLHEADISKVVEVLDNKTNIDVKYSIYDLRIAKGLTQKELANRAKMSISQIQRLEYGERKVENLSLKTALSLSKALAVPVNCLK